MGESKRHKRKSRHRASAVLKWGPAAVRAHKKIAGRTGSIHKKRAKPTRVRDVLEQIGDHLKAHPND